MSDGVSLCPMVSEAAGRCGPVSAGVSRCPVVSADVRRCQSAAAGLVLRCTPAREIRQLAGDRPILSRLIHARRRRDRPCRVALDKSAWRRLVSRRLKVDAAAGHSRVPALLYGNGVEVAAARGMARRAGTVPDSAGACRVCGGRGRLRTTRTSPRSAGDRTQLKDFGNIATQPRRILV